MTIAACFALMRKAGRQASMGCSPYVGHACLIRPLVRVENAWSAVLPALLRQKVA